MSPRGALRITSAVLLVAGIVLIGVAQALPWSTIRVEVSFNPEFNQDMVEGYQWGGTLTCDPDIKETDTTTWFGSPCEDGDEANATEELEVDGDGGEMELKAGFVAMVLGGGGLLVLAIAAMSIGSRSPTLPILMSVAWAIYLVSAILFIIGFAQLHDLFLDSFSDASGFTRSESKEFLPKDTNAGMILGFVGIGILLPAIVLDFVWRRLPRPEQLGTGAPGQEGAGSSDPYAATQENPYGGAEPYPEQGGPAEAAPQAVTGKRRLRCPRCKELSVQDAGARPVCPHCGFGG